MVWNKNKRNTDTRTSNVRSSDEYGDFDNDIESFGDTEIKINPDFYIHNAILKAQNALMKEPLSESIAYYRHLVEHVEILCKSASMVDTDYNKNIEEFKNSKEVKSMSADKQHHAIANKKLELLLEYVFSKKVIDQPLKLDWAKQRDKKIIDNEEYEEEAAQQEVDNKATDK